VGDIDKARIIHEALPSARCQQKNPGDSMPVGASPKNMYNVALMVTCFGSLATISCELRQVRKEATVAVISGAEVRLGQVTTLIPEVCPIR